ncbi:MAG: hypothetical protein KIG14_01970, partial [Candidatus Sacchiramonaceae bacterium]|nr:hypothetical protein [Candidatus Saccharimonadaceae bacterium]
MGLLQNYKSNNRGQYPPDDPSVDTGIMVGIARHTDHPFYRYVQESGLQDRTHVAIRTLGGANITPTIGGWGSDVGRIVIHKNGQCSAPSGLFGSFTI